MKKYLTNDLPDEHFDAFANQKLQDWKNHSLVEDQYFEKLPICIQQRIKMNAELQSVNPKKQNKKHFITAALVGIAASLLLYFQIYQDVESVRSFENKNIVSNNNKTEHIKTNIAPQKVTSPNNIIENNSNEKETLATHDSVPENWETAMKEITNEELESMVWELDWEENF